MISIFSSCSWYLVFDEQNFIGHVQITPESKIEKSKQDIDDSNDSCILNPKL